MDLPWEKQRQCKSQLSENICQCCLRLPAVRWSHDFCTVWTAASATVCHPCSPQPASRHGRFTTVCFTWQPARPSLHTDMDICLRMTYVAECFHLSLQADTAWCPQKNVHSSPKPPDRHWHATQLNLHKRMYTVHLNLQIDTDMQHSITHKKCIHFT